MRLNKHFIERRRKEVGAGLAVLLGLVLAGPAVAGQRTGNLAKLLLELELGGPDRLVLCDDATGQVGQCDDNDVQLGQQNVVDGSSVGLKGKDACKLVLVADPPGGRELVSVAGAAGDPGLDANKGAIGDQDNRGTGCGQLEENDHLDIQFLGLGVVESRLQFEAKQDVAAVITFKLHSVEVGSRYLVSGTADPAAYGFPASSDPDLLLCNWGTPDGNPDSGERDDCLLYLSHAHGDPLDALNPEPFHDEVSIRVVNSGALSLKGGSEYPDPETHRTSWDVVEFDGALNCGDDFSCSEAGCSVDGVTGNRTGEDSGDACVSAIPFDLDFDGREITFEYVDVNHQNPGIHLDSKWRSEEVRRADPGVQTPIDPTLLSYDPNGVSCGLGLCSNDDPMTEPHCQSNSDCDAGNTCVLPVTESCIPLATCVGTPIRSCSNDSTSTCQEDRDCGNSCANGDPCQVDGDCTDMSACLPLATCQLTDLVPPGGQFPDLVEGAETTEYGCVCGEDVRYLGPVSRCDSNSGTLEGKSCASRSDCYDDPDQGECVTADEIAVEQCLFFTGDATFLRGGKKSN